MPIKIVKKIRLPEVAPVVKEVAIPASAAASSAPHVGGPITCSFCKHDYLVPCHGNNPGCMNAAFIRGREKGQIEKEQSK